MTHPENGSGKQECETDRGSSSTPEACSLVGPYGSGRYHPRRRRAVWFSIIRAEARARGWCLPGWRDALKLVAEIEEVVLADTQFRHLLDHRQEIGQRTNRAQRWGIGRPHQSARSCQHECVFDRAHGDAALEELRGQHSVRTADGPRRTRRFTIRFQDLSNVLFLAVVHGCVPLNLAVRVATGRRCSTYGSSGVRGSAVRPPSICCRGSYATRHRPSLL